MNLGNAFDALPGSSPQLVDPLRCVDLIAQAGFNTVRIPVRWSAHAAAQAPFLIEPAFFDQVDLAINAALRRGLTVIVDVHHYHELCANPDSHTEQFASMWRQISTHYAPYGPALWLELLNEPRHRLTAEKWNKLLLLGWHAVREVDQQRTIVIGSADMNDFAALQYLHLPGDEHLVATVHYYAPFEFTHQTAPWMSGSQRWAGTKWGSAGERSAVQRDMAFCAEWSQRQGIGLFLGEFGAFQAAPQADRVRWTAAVRSEAERHGLGWCYWEFGTDFGVYDQVSGAWREDLLSALRPAATD